MIPGIELRLDSMRRAVAEVILPAIDPTNSLAVEQAMLLLGHIGLLIDQAGKADVYARLCFADLAKMASGIKANGGPVTQAAAVALSTAIGASTGMGDADYRSGTRALETLIRAADVDAEASFRLALRKQVLAFGKRQATRDRSWFAASGFDPDAASLPSIETMLRAEREAVHGS